MASVLCLPGGADPGWVVPFHSEPPWLLGTGWERSKTAGAQAASALGAWPWTLCDMACATGGQSKPVSKPLQVEGWERTGLLTLAQSVLLKGDWLNKGVVLKKRDSPGPLW